MWTKQQEKVPIIIKTTQGTRAAESDKPPEMPAFQWLIIITDCPIWLTTALQLRTRFEDGVESKSNQPTNERIGTNQSTNDEHFIIRTLTQIKQPSEEWPNDAFKFFIPKVTLTKMNLLNRSNQNFFKWFQIQIGFINTRHWLSLHRWSSYSGTQQWRTMECISRLSLPSLTLDN